MHRLLSSFILLSSLCGSLFANGQALVDELRPFAGLQGQGQVFYGGKEKQSAGSCYIDIKSHKDSYGPYNSISIQFSTSATEYVFDNMIETTQRKGDVLKFDMTSTPDYSGDIYGAFAPAKKVVRSILVSSKRVEIQRTYRCPYFFTTTTDSWICQF